MNIRQVTTSFIVQQSKVLLLKRSKDVKTYQGCWAGISGGIEKGESPFACAQREIQEETKLDPSKKEGKGGHLTFVRAGRPLTVEATPDYNTKFVVFPFLFRLEKGDAPISLNWENSEFKFVEPEKLRELNTVPNLAEAYERVSFDSEVEDKINLIRDNLSDGAAVIAGKALEILCQILSQNNIKEVSKFVEFTKNVAWVLMHVRESMASIGNGVADVVATVLQDKDYKSCEEIKEAIKGQVDIKVKEMKQALEIIVKSTGEHLKKGDSVLVHSISSTVASALSQANLGLSVYVLESRPLMEGRRMALLLASSPPSAITSVTLCCDAAIASIMPKVRLCVMGADSIGADGSFFNKTGTCIITTLAHLAEKPVLILCDTSKINPRQNEAEHGPAEQLLDPPDNNKKEISEIFKNIENGRISVFNPVFEPTPCFPNVVFVTEKGSIGKDSDTFNQITKKVLSNWTFFVK